MSPGLSPAEGAGLKEEEEEDEAWVGLDTAENLSSKGFSSLLLSTKLAKKARGGRLSDPHHGVN